MTLRNMLHQERKPPIKPTSTSTVVSPKGICSACAPQLSKLEEKYSEELHKRHIQWKQFVRFKEDEAENKYAPLITELEGKLADEQNHLKHAKETIHEQQEVQQKMVEEHAKKVKASEDEAKYWKQRYKAYEEFAIDFAKLTAPWGQTEWHGEEGSAGTNADKGLDMQ